MKEKKINEINIESTDTNPTPNSIKKLNKKLIMEDPRIPYKKITNKIYIISSLLVLTFIAIITIVICKKVIYG